MDNALFQIILPLEKFSVQIDLQSNYSTSTKLTLLVEEKGWRTISWSKEGSNSFVFRDVQNSGGFKVIELQ